MRPIQSLLIAACVSLVLFYFRQLRSRVIDRAVVLGIGAMAVALLCAPDVSTDLAHFIGVGRGADLVTYLVFAGLGFVTLLFYSQQRKLEGRVTELTRTLAILDARQPPSPDLDAPR